MLNEKKLYTNKNAALSANSRGRKKSMVPDPYRTEFQRDIHRIIYSQPFRRLRHKTQVFFLPNNDRYLHQNRTFVTCSFGLENCCAPIRTK